MRGSGTPSFDVSAQILIRISGEGQQYFNVTLSPTPWVNGYTNFENRIIEKVSSNMNHHDRQNESDSFLYLNGYVLGFEFKLLIRSLTHDGFNRPWSEGGDGPGPGAFPQAGCDNVKGPLTLVAIKSTRMIYTIQPEDSTNNSCTYACLNGFMHSIVYDYDKRNKAVKEGKVNPNSYKGDVIEYTYPAEYKSHHSHIPTHNGEKVSLQDFGKLCNSLHTNLVCVNSIDGSVIHSACLPSIPNAFTLEVMYDADREHCDRITKSTPWSEKCPTCSKVYANAPSRFDGEATPTSDELKSNIRSVRNHKCPNRCILCGESTVNDDGSPHSCTKRRRIMDNIAYRSESVKNLNKFKKKEANAFLQKSLPLPPIANNDEEYRTLITHIRNGKNVILHGSGGQGKSYMMRKLKNDPSLSDMKIDIVSTTGISSTNFDDPCTLHRWMGIMDIGDDWRTSLFKIIKHKQSAVQRIRSCDLLMIDECGMMTPETLTSFNKIISIIRSDHYPCHYKAALSCPTPSKFKVTNCANNDDDGDCHSSAFINTTSIFGGLQLVLSADFLQLPPVLDSRTRSAPSGKNSSSRQCDNGEAGADWCFQTKEWSMLQAEVINLRGCNYRFVQDPEYGEIMESVRKGTVTQPQHSSHLHSLLLRSIEYDGEAKREYEALVSSGTPPVYIMSLKKEVAKYNKECSDNLPSVAIVHTPEVIPSKRKSKSDTDQPSAPPPNGNVFKSLCLKCKVGDRVMLTRNPSTENLGNMIGILANGSTGTVKKQKKGKYIVVKFDNGTLVPIKPLSSNELYRGRYHKVKYMPLTLAWAMTVHKVQGATIPNIAVSMTNIWEGGQAYVAMSRSNTRKGLFLMNFDPLKIFSNSIATHYVENSLEKNISTFYPPNVQSMEEFRSILGAINPVFAYNNFDCSLRNEYIGFDRKTVAAKVYDFIFLDFETYRNKTTNSEEVYFSFMARFSAIENMQLKKKKGDVPDNYREKPIEVKSFHKGWQGCTDPSMDTWTEIFTTIKHRYDRKNELSKMTGGKNNADKGNPKDRNRIELSYLKEPLFIVAYNGSGFDFYWMMNSIASHSFNPEIQNFIDEFLSIHYVKRGNSIVTITIADKVSGERLGVTWDPFLITCPLSLAKATESFLGKRTKDYFPHDYINEKGYEVTLVNKPIKVPLEFYPKKDHKDLDLNPDGTVTINIFEHLYKYGRLDVESLWEVSFELDRVTKDCVGCSVFHFPTAASISMYGFLTNLPNSVLYSDEEKIVASIYDKGEEEYKEKEAIVHLLKSNLKTDHDKNRVKRRTYRYEYTKLQKPTIEMSRFFAKGTRGGKTIARHHIVEPDFPQLHGYDESSPPFDLSPDDVEDIHKRSLKYLDISGMYAHAMKSYEYPYGDIIPITQTDVECILAWSEGTGPKPPFMFMANVHVLPNPKNIEAVVSRSETISGETKKTYWDNAPRAGVYTSVDIETMLFVGDKVVSIEGGFKWSMKGYLFKDWMAKTINGKISAESKGNMGLKTVWKLLGNATFGSTCKKPQFGVRRIISNSKEYQEFLDIAELSSMVCLKDGPIVAYGIKNVDNSHKINNPQWLGAFVLAYSRRMAYDILVTAMPHMQKSCDSPTTCKYRCSESEDNLKKAAIKELPAYTDTDSFFFGYDALMRLKAKGMIGHESGQLNDDLNKDHSSDWVTPVIGLVAAAPKMYSYKYLERLPDGKYRIKTGVKSKGISSNAQIILNDNWSSEGLTYDILRHIYLEYWSPDGSTPPDRRIQEEGARANSWNFIKNDPTGKTKKDREVSPFSVAAKDLVRTIGCKCNGRIPFINTNDDGSIKIKDLPRIYSLPRGYYDVPINV